MAMYMDTVMQLCKTKFGLQQYVKENETLQEAMWNRIQYLEKAREEVARNGEHSESLSVQRTQQRDPQQQATKLVVTMEEQMDRENRQWRRERDELLLALKKHEQRNTVLSSQLMTLSEENDTIARQNKQLVSTSDSQNDQLIAYEGFCTQWNEQSKEFSAVVLQSRSAAAVLKRAAETHRDEGEERNLAVAAMQAQLRVAREHAHRLEGEVLGMQQTLVVAQRTIAEYQNTIALLQNEHDEQRVESEQLRKLLEIAASMGVIEHHALKSKQQSALIDGVQKMVVDEV